jgi:hypothetical protein
MKNQFAKYAVITITLCALVAALFAITPLPAAAAAPVKVFVNDVEISFPDALPFIDSNGRTQVPVRFVAEAMNAEVSWEATAHRADITRGRITLSMTIGVKEIVVLKVNKPMDTAPLIQDSRTFVPLRFISEGLGADVQWDAPSRTVRITDDGRDKYKVGDFLLYFDESDRVGNSITDNTLVIHKKSGLSIGEGDLGNGATAIYLQINLHNPETDVPKQREETTVLLKQRISEKLVEEIMAYAAQKQGLVDKLATQVFKESRYEVVVGGSIGPLMLTINIR